MCSIHSQLSILSEVKAGAVNKNLILPHCTWRGPLFAFPQRILLFSEVLMIPQGENCPEEQIKLSPKIAHISPLCAAAFSESAPPSFFSFLLNMFWPRCISLFPFRYLPVEMRGPFTALLK